MTRTKTILAAAFLCTILSCRKTEITFTDSVPVQVTDAVSAKATAFTETFETGTKASYAAANVTLGTGSWNLNDALIGNTAADPKSGSQSARVRNSGKLTMLFDKTGGAGTVTIAHARYGSDGNGTWSLWYSTNGGSTYTQAGTAVTAGTTTLSTATFTVNISGNIRFEIRKTDGGTNRINFDDINVSDYGTTNPPTGAKKFLFDATKAETAGNADWVIDQDNSTPQRIPTPLQATITAGTAETYWTGAISAWGIALAKQGHTVETLPSSGSITYGNASNTQDLSRYDVFVIDEPNIRFTASEKTAILNFISNGGGLFMISDHNISDRNNDGWDSPAIWNDLMTNNGAVNNPFGFSIDLTNFTQVTSNVLSSSNPILNGSQGSVTQLEFNNGASITTSTAANASVKGLIWKSTSTQGSTNLMAASSTYGTGRVFVVGDSSPMDDGTGAAGNNLFNGWGVYSHKNLFMNASLWLAKLQ